MGIFTTYNTEEANSLLEVNASQNDKDFIAAINWKKLKNILKQGNSKLYLLIMLITFMMKLPILQHL